MLLDALQKYHLILASTSPRRRHLLSEAGFDFSITDLHTTDETYPGFLNKYEIPVFLAEKKSKAYEKPLAPEEILITADTIVWLKNKVINKPIDRNDAVNSLKSLSGKTHEVITGVFIRARGKGSSFYSLSEVKFSKLEDEEIEYYVDTFRPFDKAGSYGIQEWIGYVGIEEIKGSFFNVMGLPVHELYKELKEFINFR